ncbi:hypothetical protein [Gordonia neofelifaecis]|uniref:hypothetical protein n=1 Tax=Gordonia neofelifaecis TaxID=945692 RepID=UPI001EE68D18|nr:hypothetical protein [Gordonia neofelifaecis]
MTNNNDPALEATRLGDELSTITSRLSTVSADLAALAGNLERTATVPASATTPVAEAPVATVPVATAPVAEDPVMPPPAFSSPPPPQPPQPFPPITPFPPSAPFGPPQPQLQYVTPHLGAAPFAGPRPGPFPGPTVVPGYPAAPPKRSVAERLSDAAERGLIGRVLAAVGVGITLTGIVLLLVLAAQAGLLRPELRGAAGRSSPPGSSRSDGGSAADRRSDRARSHLSPRVSPQLSSTSWRPRRSTTGCRRSRRWWWAQRSARASCGSRTDGTVRLWD